MIKIRKPTKQARLSRREKQIVKMLLAEYTQLEIAKTLGIHPNTVSDTKRRIMEKWHVKTMVGIVKEGIRKGYLEMEDDLT
ncbi:MAG: hypothetical protein CL840_20390 [Crocinitomicaceae bacterium]|nr:hypothetical protein [Crocinitomicaceae bacterium]|tara:strand:- start:933 stop:1175 length:243 start_codon:yes stop_codon:yes gene_type:complete